MKVANNRGVHETHNDIVSHIRLKSTMDESYVRNLETPIAIIGLGKSGRSALSLLTQFGFDHSKIITFDEKNSDAMYSQPSRLAELQIKTLVVSPGVSLKSAWLQSMLQKGAHLTSEITIAASLLTSERVIGVTGSVGKSTVVSLLGAGLKTFDEFCFVGGNLGVPFCDYSKNTLDGKLRATWIVLELSSYQLENCKQLKLENSIITFLSANHLERYENLEEYYATKLKITSITTGVCLFNSSSADCVALSSKSHCGSQLVNSSTFSRQKLLADISLIGNHNKDNFSLAAEMAIICKWPESVFAQMSAYTGLAHRLEFVASVNGVTFINDSKATAMDSVLVASRGCLEGVTASNKVFLLLGGKDKNLPWEDLAVLSSNESIEPVFFGACGALAKKKSELSGEIFEKLGAAITFCQKRARAGDVVLLSPGGTSLDEFNNFEERGDFFKAFVRANSEL